MTPDDALAALMALTDPVKAGEMAAYHKIPRRYLGIAVPQIDALARDWRQTLTLDDRLSLAAALWDMGSPRNHGRGCQAAGTGPVSAPSR